MEYGLIGKTLKHSYSKTIHEFLTKHPYEMVEVSEEELKDILVNKNLKGANVTIPYKEFVIPFLDEVSDEVRDIGACNTIINVNGKLVGHNTDYFGLRRMIMRHEIPVEGKHCYIFGTGGTKETAHKVLTDLGAASITVVSRTKKPGCITYEELVEEGKKVEFILNATPCGMWPNNHAKMVSLSSFPNLKGVVDVIYNPLNTPLVVEAKVRGIPAMGGLEMLILQAMKSNALFYQKEHNTNTFERLHKNLYYMTKSIVLIGLPMSGKTTVGKKLAEDLGKRFVDIDEEIETRTGKTIPEIFAESGEAGFRKIESEVIADVSKDHNLVIATGGGAVLNSQNMYDLMENGLIFYIQRSVENMIYSDHRPLTKSKEDLLALQKTREPLYQKYQKFTVTNDEGIEECVREIKEKFHESIDY